MTTISAYRDKPITRPGRVEAVLCKFGIGPHIATFIHPLSAKALQVAIADGLIVEDETPWPKGYRSKFSWDESEDGEIWITIDFEDGAKTADLIRELRFCGFVAGVES
jgi:hypothetical protein